VPGRETTHRYPRIAVIANPGAGSTDPTYVRGIEELCRAHSAHTEVFWTRRRVHAAALARRVACAVPGYDAVVSVGGDGTLREVVTGLRAAEVARRPTLVVQPGGTANSNFRSLWDDVPWQNALTSALTGAGAEERELDLALFAELQRIVVLGTSTGLFAEATAAALDVPVAGRARYQVALNAVQASYVPYTGRVTVDGTGPGCSTCCRTRCGTTGCWTCA
jgi:diacylglycerol kinase (ATP)